MMRAGIDWSAIHGSGRWSALTPMLALGALLYGAAVRFHQAAYARGCLNARRLPGFVLSVGNLCAGGTGKTPAVEWLARWAHGRGYAVAVLSRGYKRTGGKGCLVVSDGNEIKAGPDEAGDEPWLLASRLTGVPVVVGADRWQAGWLASRMFGSSFFVLDDGFQHRALARNFDLVLLDGTKPLGNGHLLPWGPLREPQSALRRAHAFVLTGCGRRMREEQTLRHLERDYPGKPVFRALQAVDEWIRPFQGGSAPPAGLQGQRVMAFAGIAGPGRFLETLEGLGVQIAAFRIFPDHYRYREEDLDALIREQDAVGACRLVTTEKDWVKIQGLTRCPASISFLRIRFQIVGEEGGLLKAIEERIS